MRNLKKTRYKILLLMIFVLAILSFENVIYARHGNKNVNFQYPLSGYNCDSTGVTERQSEVNAEGGLNQFTINRVGPQGDHIDWVYQNNTWVQHTMYVQGDALYNNCLFVYGTPSDVPENAVEGVMYAPDGSAQYNYLGYDVHGKPYPNPRYPEFFAQDGVLTDGYVFSYWKHPWDRPWASAGLSRPLFDEFVGPWQNSYDSSRYGPLSRALDKYHNSASPGYFAYNQPQDGVPWINGIDATELSQYADIEYPGDDWTAGSFTLYFDVNGHTDVYGYTTFLIPPLKNPFQGNASTTISVDTNVYHNQPFNIQTILKNESFSKPIQSPCTVGNLSYTSCRDSSGWTNWNFIRVKKGLNQNNALDGNVVFDDIINDGSVVNDGGSKAITKRYSLPAGDYTAWVKIPDYANESNADDNWASVNFTVKPVDLALLNYFTIDPNTPQKSDTPINGMGIQVQNNTDESLGAFDIQYYWASNPTQTMCEEIPGIGANQTLNVVLGAGQNQPCPGQINPSTKYPRYTAQTNQSNERLVVNVNYNHNIDEIDYSNNKKTFTVPTNGLNAYIYSSSFSYYAVNQNESKVTVQTKIANKMNKMIDAPCTTTYSPNSWTIKEYNKVLANDRIPPTFADLSGLTPSATYTTNDITHFAYTSGSLNNKLYNISTNINVPYAETVTLPVTGVDDSVGVYVNGTFVGGGALGDTLPINIDIPLTAGNNNIQILYYQNSGPEFLTFGKSLNDVLQGHEVCDSSGKTKLTYTIYNSNWTSDPSDDTLVTSWTKTYSNLPANTASAPIVSSLSLPPGQYRLVTEMPHYLNETNYADNIKTDYFEVSISEDNQYIECKDSTPKYITNNIARFCVGMYPNYPSTKIEQGQGTYYYVKYRFFPMPLPTYHVDNNLGVNKFTFEGHDNWNDWSDSSPYWSNINIYNDPVLGSVYKANNKLNYSLYYDYTKDATGNYYYSFTAGHKYQFSIWLKADSPINNAGLLAYDTKTNATTPINVTNTLSTKIDTTWARYDMTFTATQSGKFGVGYLIQQINGNRTIYAALPSLNEVLSGNTTNTELRQQYQSIEPLDEIGNTDSFLYYGNATNRGRLFPTNIKFDFQVLDPQGNQVPQSVGTIYYTVPNTCMNEYSLDFDNTVNCREVSFYIPNNQATLVDKTLIPDQSKRLMFTNPGTHTFNIKATETQKYYFQHNSNTSGIGNPSWGPVNPAGNFTQTNTDWRYNFSNPSTNFMPPASLYNQSSWNSTNDPYQYNYQFTVSGLSSGDGKK